MNRIIFMSLSEVTHGKYAQPPLDPKPDKYMEGIGADTIRSLILSDNSSRKVTISSTDELGTEHSVPTVLFEVGRNLPRETIGRIATDIQHATRKAAEANLSIVTSK